MMMLIGVISIGPVGFDNLLQSGGRRLRGWRIDTRFPSRGPSSVILGVKNREELSECVEAEHAPRLTDSQCKQIEAACA
jgi:hypothetical protein